MLSDEIVADRVEEMRDRCKMVDTYFRHLCTYGDMKGYIEYLAATNSSLAIVMQLILIDAYEHHTENNISMK